MAPVFTRQDLMRWTREHFENSEIVKVACQSHKHQYFTISASSTLFELTTASGENSDNDFYKYLNDSGRDVIDGWVMEAQNSVRFVYPAKMVKADCWYVCFLKTLKHSTTTVLNIGEVRRTYLVTCMPEFRCSDEMLSDWLHFYLNGFIFGFAPDHDYGCTKSMVFTDRFEEISMLIKAMNPSACLVEEEELLRGMDHDDSGFKLWHEFSNK